MKPNPIFVLAATIAVIVCGAMAFSAGGASDESAPDESSPIYGIKLPSGYRDWRLISVAHEEGKLNDLRALLGNDVAIKAYREGKLPFPDGTIIARLAWSYVPSEENNNVFGRAQSFVAGPPKNGVQFMVKDSKKYASTGGWGFAQFNDGKPADEALHETCFSCHEPAKDHDFVFTHYALDIESRSMPPEKLKTVIVTGASQGIGAGIAKAFLDRGYKVVATSRNMTSSAAFSPSDNIALVDGDIGDPRTAASVAQTAVTRFGSIDALVNNAGIFFTKSFTDYTAEDFRSLVSTNLGGFLYVTQLAVKQMLAQKTGGSVVTITASLAANPIAGVKASVPMITKGGLDTITRHLAMEYAKEGIRFNAVAPGVVDTPLHKDEPKEALRSLNPMGVLSSVQEIVDGVMYLTDATTVTGDILYVDGGAHFGRW